MDAVPLHGVEAITLPGAVDAFCRLSDDHGKLGLDALLAPAIHYAEEGVPVAPRVAFDLPIAGACLQGHGLRHYMPTGAPLQAGQIFRATAQAKVLRKIAATGRDAFYTGEVAEDMLATLNTLGGQHTAEDFTDTHCDYAAPVSGGYQGTELIEHPPKRAGGYRDPVA